MSKAKLQSLILIASLLLNALFLGLFLSPFLFKGPSPIRKVFMTAMLKRHPLLSEFHEALMKNHAKNDFKSVRTKISAAISAEEFNEAEFREAFAGAADFHNNMHNDLVEDFTRILSKYPQKDRLQLVEFMEKRFAEMPMAED